MYFNLQPRGAGHFSRHQSGGTAANHYDALVARSWFHVLWVIREGV